MIRFPQSHFSLPSVFLTNGDAPVFVCWCHCCPPARSKVQRGCWGAAVVPCWDGKRRAAAPAAGTYVQGMGFTSCDRNFWGGSHKKRVLVALVKYAVEFLGGKKKVKFNLEKRGRKKAGRKQAEFSACILSTHPCVSFPSGRNKNCLCFSRPFRKSYRAIIALLSNGQSLFRLSLLPLPT